MASTQYTASITLYKGVPFDNTYQHTLIPKSVAVKKIWLDDNYGSGKVEQTQLMFIKIDTTTNKGIVRLNVSSNDARKYNYCYINDGKGNTYFCFILGCRYINDGPSDNSILYEYDLEIDIMMSYLTNTSQLKQAPIDRHHGVSSTFRNYRIAEPLPLGEYASVETIKGFDNTWDCYGGIMFIPDIKDDGYLFEEGKSIYMDNMFGVPTGARIAYFDLSRIRETQNALKDFIKNPQQIISIFTVPKFLLKSNPGVYLESGSNSDYQIASTEWTVYDSLPETIGGSYIPRNKKLLRYPYSFGRLYNDVGNYTDIRFENWAHNEGYKVCLQGCPIPEVSVKAFPKDYNGFGGADTNIDGNIYRLNPEATVEISNYPLGSAATDSYSAYIANNGKSIGFNVGVSAAKFLSGDVSGAKDLMNTFLNLQYMKDRQDDKVVGNISNGNDTNMHKQKRFLFRRITIKADMAEYIDSYFTRYGYAQAGLVTTPSLMLAKYFTYVKTLDNCFVPGTSGANNNQTKQINQIFMSGCTFWNDGTITSSNIFAYSSLTGNITES